jgi:hypothetical protein
MKMSGDEAGRSAEDPPSLNDLVVNPDVEVEVTIRVRRRGEPAKRVRLTSPDELALGVALLAHQASKEPCAWISPARRLGVLARASELPDGLDPLRFEAALDRDAVALAPRHQRDAPLPEPRALTVNPDVIVQEGASVPAAIDVPAVDRVVSGPSAFSQRRPIAWIRDPYTSMILPFWFEGEWGGLLESVVIDRQMPSEVPPDALRALILCRALVPRESPAPIWDESDRSSGSDHVVLRDLVNPLWLGAARLHYRRLRENGYFDPDECQVPFRRDGIYCDFVTLLLQEQVLQVIQRLVDEPARSSYTWYFEYHSCATLEPHKDRPQCRWNVSLCMGMEPELERDAAWPLELGGKRHPVRLAVGDGVLYSGTDTVHGRPPLAAGHRYGACFLHYVPRAWEGGLR